MALQYIDRAQETTSTTGTGTLTLAGATTQFQAFGTKLATGDTAEYTILSGDGTSWEVGIGTYTTSGNTFSRDTVYDGSSGPGVKISLVGTSTVFVDCPAHRIARGGLYNRLVSLVPTSTNTGLTTWLNQGSSSFSNATSGLLLVPQTQAGLNIRGIYKTAPATPYTITILIAMDAADVATLGAGIGWYDGSAKLQLIALSQNTTSQQVAVNHYSSPTVFVASDAGPSGMFQNPLWMRISDNGTTVSFSWSLSGEFFVPMFSVAKASGYLGATGYTDVIFWCQTQTNGALAAVLESYQET